MTPPFFPFFQIPKQKKNLLLALLLGICLGLFSQPLRAHSQETPGNPEDAQIVADPQEDDADDVSAVDEDDEAELMRTGVLCHSPHHKHRHHHHHHHLHHCHHGPRGAVMLQSGMDQDEDDFDLMEADINQE